MNSLSSSLSSRLSSFSRVFSFCVLALFLAACQTGDPGSSLGDDRAARIDAALDRAAGVAAATGKKGASLGYLERIYKRSPDNAENAVRYADALHQAGYLNRAALVIGPFADDPAGPGGAKTVFAAVKLAKGQYVEAERYAQQAIVQDEKDFKAYQYLGVALDARSMHEPAERAFRKALEHWQGDPVPIMNNLALNLTSQGMFEEAITILEKAQALAPDRVEVERNLRIARALQQSHGRDAPKPAGKPGH